MITMLKQGKDYITDKHGCCAKYGRRRRIRVCAFK